MADVAAVREVPAHAHEDAAGARAERPGESGSRSRRSPSAAPPATTPTASQSANGSALPARARRACRRPRRRSPGRSRAGRAGGDPRERGHAAEREPRDEAGPAAREQQARAATPSGERERRVADAEQRCHGVLVRSRRVVERQDELVARAADQQLAGREAGDRDPSAAAPAPAFQSIPVTQPPANAMPAPKTAPPAIWATGSSAGPPASALRTRAEAGRDQERQQDELRATAIAKPAAARAAVERRMADRTVEAEPPAGHHRPGRKARDKPAARRSR